MDAATGITLNTLAASLEAVNSTSGDISITQLASPAQTLTITGTGVVNNANGGAISITNLGASIAVSGGVNSTNGDVTLAATDFQISGTINSGTAVTTLANSTAGRQIDLGTNTPGKIGLTGSELNKVTAGVLRIGSVTAGAINVSAGINYFNSPLSLINADVVTEAAAGFLNLFDLRVSSTGPVTLDSSANFVDVLAASTANSFSFNNGGNTLTIGVEDGVTGVTTSNSDIALTADNLDIQQAINAGAGRVTLQPFTNALQIDLGTASVPGSTFGLTDVELGQVTAGVLQVGDTNVTGGAIISSAITRHTGFTTLSLREGGPISQTAPLSVANLDVFTTTGDVTLTNAGNDVDTLAGGAFGGANFHYVDSNALIVGNVDQDSGIESNNDLTITTGGTLTINSLLKSDNTQIILTAGDTATEGASGQILAPNLELLGTGPYTLNSPSNDVTTLAANVTNGVSYTDANALSIGTVGATSGVTTNGHDISITASAVTSGTTLTVSQPINTTGAANITLSADRMSLGAAVNAHAGIVTLKPTTTGRAIDLGANTDTTHLGLLQTDLNEVTAGVLRIGDLGTGGSITVTAAITDATTGFSTLSLLTEVGAGISQNSGATLTITNLNAGGNTGVTLNENNVVSTLAGATQSGAFSFTDHANLTVGSVDSGLGSGFGVGIITQGQAVNLTVNVLNDSLTVNQHIDTTHNFGTPAPGGADINLTADQMSFNAGINAGATGIVTLTPFTPGQSIAGAGTISSAGTAVTGVGTTFATQVVVGDLIGNAASGFFTVTAVADNTHLTIAAAPATPFSGSAYRIQTNPISFALAETVTLTTPNAGANSFTLTLTTPTTIVAIPTTGSEPDNVSASQLQADFNAALANAGVSGGASVTEPSAGVYDIIFFGAGVQLTASGTATPTVARFVPPHMLDLNNANLDQISAKVVRIGSASQTKDISIDGAINPTGFNTLDLIAGGGGAIVESSGSIQVANLALLADAGIGSAGAIVVVGPINLAFRNATSNNVQISSTGALTIAKVDTLDGTAGHEVANLASGGTVTLTASSPMTFAVNTSSSGTYSATTTETASETGTPLPPPDDDITVNANVTVESTGGDVDLTSGDSIVTQAGSLLKSDTGAVNLTAGMGDNDSDATLELNGSINSANVSISSPGDICVGGIAATGTVSITSTGGAILDCGDTGETEPATPTGDFTNGASVDITAGTLNLSASTGIGIVSGMGVGPLETQVSNLEAKTSTGGIFITNGVTSAVTLNIVGNGTNVTPDGVVVTGASGDIQLINQGGINVVTNFDVVRSPDNITVQAFGATSDIQTGGQDGTFNAIRSTGSGNVSVTAGQDILMGNASGFGSIVAAGGNTTVSAGRNLVIDFGSRLSVDGGAGDVTATAGGNITMQQTGGTSGANVSNSGSGNISLTTGAGGTFTLDSGAGGQVLSSGGNITISADSMVINDPINAGTGIITLAPFTSGRPIDVGHNPSLLSGELGLSQSDLNNVTASVLRIGSSSAGSIAATAAITDVGTGWSTLSLITGSTVSEPTGSLTVTSLAVQAASLIGLGGSNAVSNLAGSSTSSGFVFGDSLSLTVTTVDGVSGISTGAVILVESTVANTSLTVSQPVTTNGGQDITFTFDNMTLTPA